MKQVDTDKFSSPRMQNEAKTIEVMIHMYCRAHHNERNLCQQCNKLLMYAKKRLQRCIFQSEKPVCGNCTVHCYKREMQEEICKVMRYAGPRMSYRHPIIAIRHLWDKRRKTPPLPKGKAKGNRTQPNNCDSKKRTGPEGGK